MHVEAEAWARDRRWDDANKVTEAVFTFVAVGPIDDRARSGS